MSNIKYMLRDAKNRRAVFTVIAVMSVIAVFAVFFALERPGVTLTEGSVPSYVSYDDNGEVVVVVDETQDVVDTGTSSTNCTWTLYADGVMSFKPTDNSTTYTINSTAWSTYKYQVKAIKAAEGLTLVGSNTFKSFTNLEVVDLSDSSTTLTNISNSAFYGCTALTDVNMGETSALTYIGNSAFYGCTALEKFPFENTPKLETISASAFCNCKSLKEVNLSNSNVKYLYSNAFQNCTSLKTVDLSDTKKLSSISASCFSGDTALETLNLENSALTTISSSAFSGCTALTSVDFSGCTKLSSIGQNAFSGCSKLTSLDFSDTVLTTVSSGAFQKCSSLTSVTFGEGSLLTTIGADAFYYCSKLDSVDFENLTKLTTIGGGNNSSYGAFSCCNLTSVDLSNCTLLKTVSGYAFYSNKSLTEISLPSSVTTIDTWAFGNCTSLKTINADFTKLTTLGASAFNSCSSLKTFPFEDLGNVTSLGASVFSGCSSLETADLSALTEITALPTNLFSGCTSLKYIDLSTLTQITEIPNYMFNGCTALEYVNFGDNSKINKVGSYAFKNCTSLTEFPLENLTELESIGVNAFEGCKSLEKADFSKLTKLTEIPNQLFYNCSSLEKVELSKNSPVTSIGYGAFSNCTSLASFPFNELTNLETFVSYDKGTTSQYGTFANTALTSADLSICEITEIPACMFYGCKNLSEIKYGDNLSKITKIGNYAFYGNEMESFPFEKMTSLTTIGSYAFADCANLKSADLSNCTELSGSLSGTFKDCTSLEYFDVADNCKIDTIESAAFSNCTLLSEFPFDKMTGLKKISGGYNSYVFNGCPFTEIDLTKTALETISYAFNSNTITKADFSGLENLSTVGTSAVTSTALKEVSFKDCSSLSTISSSYSLSKTALESLDFSGCTSLTSLSKDFTQSMSKLKKIDLTGSGLTQLAVNQFQGCTALEEVILKDCASLEIIGNYAFSSTPDTKTDKMTYNCKNLKTVDLSGCTGLKTIGNGAFIQKEFLTGIDLSDCTSLETIGDRAFQNDKSITEITLPLALNSIGTLAFNGCIAVDTINYDSQALGTVDTNAFYGIGRTTDLTVNVGTDVDSVLKGIFKSNIQISELNFLGVNDSIVLGKNSFDVVGSPLTAMADGETKYYVDEYGVIYSEDKTELYMIPANYINEEGESVPLTEYTVPNTVTTVKTGACRLADNLTTLRFANIGDVTSVEASAFAQCVTLKEITAGSKTATTVQEAEELFSKAEIGTNAFYLTGLTDESYDGGTVTKEQIESTTQTQTGAEEYYLRATISKKESGVLDCGKRLPNIEDDDVDENVYYYLTNEQVTINVNYGSLTAETNKIARVYLLCSSDDIDPSFEVGNVTFSLDDGTVINAELHKEGNLYYLEFEMEHGSTGSFDFTVTYPNFVGDGAYMKLWTQIVDNEDYPIDVAPEKYQQAQWYTAIYKWNLGYTSKDTDSFVQDGDGVKLKNDFSFTISSKSDYNENVSNGIDFVSEMNYTEWLDALPEGISWKESVIKAIQNGDWYVTGASGETKYVYVKTDDGDLLLMYFNSNCDASDITVEWDDEKGVIAKWKKKNSAFGDTTSTAYEMSNYSNGTITYNADGIFAVDMDTYDFENSSKITSNVIQTPKYLYAYEDEVSAYDESVFEATESASVTIGKGAPDLSIEKNTWRDPDSGYHADIRYDVYGGEQEFFNLTVKNNGVVATTVTQLKDELPCTGVTGKSVIRPENIDKMFADTYGHELTIKIGNAYYSPTVKANGKDTVTTTDGDSAQVAAQLKNDRTSLGIMNLTWSADEDCIVLTNNILGKLKIGKGKDYESVEALFDEIGLVNRSNTYYYCYWYMCDEHKTIQPLEERVYVVRASTKTAFEKIDDDQRIKFGQNNFAYNHAYLYSDSLATGSIRNSDTYIYIEDISNWDYSITKGVYDTGSTKDKTSLVPGDVLNYTLTVGHYGNYNDYIDETTTAIYGIVPLNDTMTGSQAALALVEGNEKALFTDSQGKRTYLYEAGLRIYTDTDGTKYYVLNKTGTYTNIMFGELNGKLVKADRIEVKQGETTVDTNIYWYYNEYDYEDGTGAYTLKMKYKSLCDERVGSELNLGYFSIENTTWLGEWAGDRLYDTIGGLYYNMAEFDKVIVTENAGTDDEKVAKRSDIVEGDAVTYKLIVENKSSKYALAVTDAYDQLPDTYGDFAWSKDNVVSMKAVSSLGTVNTTADRWKISTYNPEGIQDGRYYIYWNDTEDEKEKFSNIVLQPNEKLSIYVTVEFPNDKLGGNEWNYFELHNESKPDSIINTFFVGGNGVSVKHSIKVGGKAYLQKGVYGVYNKKSADDSVYTLTSTGDRSVYENKTQNSAYVTYYVTVYNSSSARLYLTEMTDFLPAGFVYNSLCAISGNGSASTMTSGNQNLGEGANLSGTNYPVANSNYAACKKNMLTYSATSSSDKNLLATVSDENYSGDIKYVSAYVTCTSEKATDENGNYTETLKFSFSDTYKASTSTTYSKANINSDKYGCYLDQGQAIVFGYTVSVPETAYTGDTAVNKIAMQYYDYNGAGFKMSEGVSAEGGYTDRQSVNDGSCSLMSNFEAASDGYDGQYLSDWLTSDVTLVKGEIVPGISKAVTSYTPTNGTETALSEGGSIDSMKDTVNWSVNLYSQGDGTIDKYTITDTMQNPFFFKGNVTYVLTDKAGNKYSSTRKGTDTTSWNKSYADCLLMNINVTKDESEITNKITYKDRDNISVSFETMETSSNIDVKKHTVKLGDTEECTVYWYGNTGMSAVAKANGATDANKITFKVLFDIDESGNFIMKLTFDEGTFGWLGISSDCQATMTVQTTGPSNYNMTSSFVNTARFTPVADYDSTDVSRGTVVKENDEVVGIEDYASIMRTGSIATMSWKSITEDGNKENTANSYDDINYIVLEWDDESDVHYSGFTYGLNVKNQSNTGTLKQLVIIDNLPETSDTMAYSDGNTARNSEFEVSLQGLDASNFAVKNGDKDLDPDKYTIEVSTEDKHFDDTDYSGGTAGKWMTLNTAKSKIADGSLKLKEIRSYRVIVNDDINAGEILTVEVEALISGNPNPGEIAWNNFGYKYNAVNTNGNNVILSASSLNVGVMTATVPKLKKEIQAGTGREIKADEFGTTAKFVIYKGDQITYESDSQILQTLLDENKKFTVVDITMEQIDNGTYVPLENLYQYEVVKDADGNYSYEQTTSLWKWKDGEKYSFTEIGIPEHFIFSTMKGSQVNGATITYSKSGRYKISCLNLYNDYNISVMKYDSSTGDGLKDAGFARYGIITGDPNSETYQANVKKLWSDYVDSYIEAVKQVENSESSVYTMNTVGSKRLEAAKEQGYDAFSKLAVTDITSLSEVGDTFSQMYRIKNSDGTETTYFFVQYENSNSDGYATFKSLTDENFGVLEVTAPEGYTLGYRMYTVSRGSTACGGTQYLKIPDSYAEPLPITGGSGMLYIIFGGTSLMLFATAAAVIRLRRRGAQAE